PEIEGAARFKGSSYFTSSWPHDGVDFTGKRVAVIGTGSSAVQSIPLIAKQAKQLTVFQRTPAYSIPAHNGPVRNEKRAEDEKDRKAYRHAARYSRAGVPVEPVLLSALAVSDDERRARYDYVWQAGDLMLVGGAYADIITNEDANKTLSDYMR